MWEGNPEKLSQTALRIVKAKDVQIASLTEQVAELSRKLPADTEIEYLREQLLLVKENRDLYKGMLEMVKETIERYKANPQLLLRKTSEG